MWIKYVTCGSSCRRRGVSGAGGEEDILSSGYQDIRWEGWESEAKRNSTKFWPPGSRWIKRVIRLLLLKLGIFYLLAHEIKYNEEKYWEEVTFFWLALKSCGKVALYMRHSSTVSCVSIAGPGGLTIYAGGPHCIALNTLHCTWWSHRGCDGGGPTHVHLRCNHNRVTSKG